MSATDIIQLPGTDKWAMRFVVEMWIAAGSPTVNSAGRLHADQKYLWDHRNDPGFNPADNPDDPGARLPHLRGFALDIDPTGDRPARLKAAGFFQPLSYEPWHWEPAGRSVWDYPKVYALPAFTSSTPFTTLSGKDDAMGLRIISSPYYRSAQQQVIHNGLAAKPIPNVVAGALRAGGVPAKDYENEDDFNAELAEVWNLGKVVSEKAGEAMADEFGERLTPRTDG